MVSVIFLTAVSIMLVSLSGVLFVGTHLHCWIERHLPILVTLSAGVFLVTSFRLAEEALELTTPAIALGAIIAGFLMFFCFECFVPESHHHHEGDCHDEHSKPQAARMLMGDAVHNIGDGIVLVPAFLIDINLGIAAAVSILVHEFIQEISEFFVLRKAGYTTKQALTRNFATSASILIGVLIGLLVSSHATLQALFLGLAAGAFLYIVVHDLAPHEHILKSDRRGSHLLAFVIGIALIFAVNTFTPHGHAHEPISPASSVDDTNDRLKEKALIMSAFSFVC